MRWIGAVALVAASLLGACGGTSPANSSSSQSSKCLAQAKATTHYSIKAGGIGGVADGVFFVAQAKGFFADQNLDVTVTDYRSISDMLPLLASGQLDVAAAGDSPSLWNAINANAAPKIVSDLTIIRDPKAGPNIRNSGGVVVSQKLYDSGVRSVTDLKGKKVAVNSLGSLSEFQLQEVLAYHKMSISDVSVQQVGFTDQLTALGTGKVDAAMMIEPFMTLAKNQKFGQEIFDEGYALPDEPAQLLTYSVDFAAKQTEAGQRLLVAMMKSVRYIEDAFVKGVNRDEVVGYYVKNTSLKDPALYSQMGTNYNETNAKVDAKWLQKDLDFFGSRGLLKVNKPTPSALVDTSFGQCALQVVGTYKGV